MAQSRFKIIDESEDKKYFTIVPNYVINHSHGRDQSLYLQMKRFAGEDGLCFATEKTLMKELDIGKKAFDKSLNYLLKNEWIEFVGMSNGKTRPIRTYKIKDIWDLNMDFYSKKISAESNISLDKSQKEGDKCQKQHKISAESNTEEEPIKEEHINNNPIAAPEVAAWDFKKYLAEMDNNKRRDINIIAFFFREKRLSFDNKGQVESAIKRHLRPAKDLVPFTDEQLSKAADKAEAEFPSKWTLETLLKILSK